MQSPRAWGLVQQVCNSLALPEYWSAPPLPLRGGRLLAGRLALTPQGPAQGWPEAGAAGTLVHETHRPK